MSSTRAGMSRTAKGWAALPSLFMCLAWTSSQYDCLRGLRFLIWWLTFPRANILRNLGKSAKLLTICLFKSQNLTSAKFYDSRNHEGQPPFKGRGI